VEATDLAEDSASGEATNTSGGPATPEGGVPSSPRDVEALIVSARFITLRWKEPLVPNGAIIGYSVLYRQEGSERYFHPNL
jgi:Fibronectin type III domain